MRLIDADELKTITSIQKGNFNSIEGVQEWIDKAPTVITRPTELYVEAEYIQNGLMWNCSNCGAGTRIMKKYNVPNYCPCCGAKMSKGGGENV